MSDIRKIINVLNELDSGGRGGGGDGGDNPDPYQHFDLPKPGKMYVSKVVKYPNEEEAFRVIVNTAPGFLNRIWAGSYSRYFNSIHGHWDWAVTPNEIRSLVFNREFIPPIKVSHDLVQYAGNYKRRQDKGIGTREQVYIDTKTGHNPEMIEPFIKMIKSAVDQEYPPSKNRPRS